MPTVDNLLHMERCASCQRELAAHWKFCVYCGRPFVAAAPAPAPLPAPEPDPDSSLAKSDAWAGAEVDGADKPRRRFDGAFWVGVGMGVLGIALIVYAAVQIYGGRS